MTVTEYETEFYHLTNFASPLIPTEESRARHFEEGLRFCIKEAIISFELTKYSKVVCKALLVEMAQLIGQEEQSAVWRN